MSAVPPMHPGSSPIDTRDRDDEHLHLLGIFYYIWGALIALMSCCGSIYAILGIVALVNPEAMRDSNTGEPVDAAFGWIFTGIGLVTMLLCWVLAGLAIYAGRCLQRKVHRTFCFVVAGLSCLSVPLGTILGVFTIIVLARDTVAAKFDRSRSTV